MILGVGMILSGMGVIGGNAYLIAMTVVFAAITVRSLISLNFTLTFLGLGHLAHLYRTYLEIPDSLASWLLILAAVLIGVGLDFIFKNVRKKVKHRTEAGDGEVKIGAGVTITDDDETDNEYVVEDDEAEEKDMTEDDLSFHIENNFHTRTEYIHCGHFTNGHIENGFGSITAYLDNVVMAENHANLHLENGFGNITVNLPSSWAMELHEENGMGDITVKGIPSSDPEAPCVRIHAENGFGKIFINFI